MASMGERRKKIQKIKLEFQSRLRQQKPKLERWKRNYNLRVLINHLNI
jgi:hypothetical protein